MKGLFIPDITTEMFRNGCLEGIEALMAEGELYDIEYNPKQPTIEPQRTGRWMPTEPDEPCFYRCSECGRLIDERENFCPNCGADMREPEDIPMEYFESGGR